MIENITYDYDYDPMVGPPQEQEVVTLGSQTPEEVKKILKEAEELEKEKAKEQAKVFKELEDECKREKNYKYAYEEELRDCELPDLGTAREVCGFRKDVDIFALWRKLADVKLGTADDDLEPKSFCATKDLMDYITLKLERRFRKLKLGWSDTWNPVLTVNGCDTKISMAKLALAYQGLINVTEELNAQAVICNIVIKKLEELFV